MRRASRAQARALLPVEKQIEGLRRKQKDKKAAVDKLDEKIVKHHNKLAVPQSKLDCL